jgi:hypothetical protein
MSQHPRHEEFLLEIQKIHRIVDMLVDHYGMRGEVVNVMLTGMLSFDEFDEPVLKAVYSLDVNSDELLDEAFDFLRFSYEEPPELDEQWQAENWYRDILNSLDGFDPTMN